MIYLVIFSHWFADFVMQNDKMAINKSTSNLWLGNHVCMYTLCMLPFGLKYATVNGAIHFCVDWVTSRRTSTLWKQGRRHDFFVVIGLDQAIHMAFLILTMPLIGWDL
jgi:hypothetical protein